MPKYKISEADGGSYEVRDQHDNLIGHHADKNGAQRHVKDMGGDPEPEESEEELAMDEEVFEASGDKPFSEALSESPKDEEASKDDV